jgi:predicted transcriptional regulator
VSHKGHNNREKRNRRRAHRAAELKSRGYTQKTIAEKMSVSQASVSRYLKMYRTGTYVAPETA